MGRKPLKGVPDYAAQRKAVCKGERRRLKAHGRPARKYANRGLASVCGNDPEYVAILTQLRTWASAQRHATGGSGRKFNTKSLYTVAAEFDRRRVKLIASNSSEAARLLWDKEYRNKHGVGTGDLPAMSEDGARDLLQRLVEISKRIGAR